MGIALLAGGASPASGAPSGQPDCTGPAGNPAPATAAWYKREADNAWCGEQRYWDTMANPAFVAASRPDDAIREDPFRDPSLYGGIRFRYQRVSFASPSGQKLPG